MATSPNNSRRRPDAPPEYCYDEVAAAERANKGLDVVLEEPARNPPGAKSPAKTGVPGRGHAKPDLRFWVNGTAIAGSDWSRTEQISPASGGGPVTACLRLLIRAAGRPGPPSDHVEDRLFA
jgi:hypothetical protein